MQANKRLLLLATILAVIVPAYAGSEAVLHAFSNGNDGGNPLDAGTLLKKGAEFYGTAVFGGKNGCGTIFKFSASNLKTLHAFDCSGEGANPSGGVVADGSGVLYGTTTYGGPDGCGTVFKLSGYKFTTLYSFGCGADGASPAAGVILDKNKNLYGTAALGGAKGGGVAYMISPTREYTVIYDFCSRAACSDGQYPYSGLTMDTEGNLYGTTYEGGVKGCYQKVGCGTVFELSLLNGKWSETILYRFTGQNGDGSYPESAGLTIQDGMTGKNAKEAIFGVTSEGGAAGDGIVFELVKAKKGNTLTIIHSFDVSAGDGGSPMGTLIGGKGALIGTTQAGGQDGYGTVFELTGPRTEGESWAETVLYSFTGGGDGGYPESGVARDSAGNLYGVTFSGGRGYGVAYSLLP